MRETVEESGRGWNVVEVEVQRNRKELKKHIPEETHGVYIQEARQINYT